MSLVSEVEVLKSNMKVYDNKFIKLNDVITKNMYINNKNWASYNDNLEVIAYMFDTSNILFILGLVITIYFYYEIQKNAAEIEKIKDERMI